MLWRPSQSSLMSSRSWGRQLLCESSNEEWKQPHWFVVKIWGCFNIMMTFTLSMTPLLPTVLCLAAPIEFWTANRRRLYKRQGHCYKVDVWLLEWWRLYENWSSLLDFCPDYLYTITNSSLLLYLEGKSVCLEVTLRVGELEPESFSVYLEQQRYKTQIGAQKLESSRSCGKG